MKKRILFAAAIVFCLLAQGKLFAQGNDFNDVKGINLLNAGVGLGSYGLYGTGGLPLTASFEHGVSKNISAGIEAGFIQRKFAYDWKYSYFMVGLRGSYHFNEALSITNSKLDVYGGAGLLYRHFTVKYGDAQPDDYYGGKSSSGAMTIDLHAGGRYFFNEHVGAYAELGYGISPLKLGISLKF
jgi:hypothetical protein